MFKYLVVTLVLLPSIAYSKSNNICDYYDQYGNFILSFDDTVKLIPSGANINSGISFIFPDESTLKIFTGIETYDPLVDNDEDISIPDELRFIHKYDKNDCKISYISKLQATVITCENYEYTIFSINAGLPQKVFVYIFYHVKSKNSRVEYEKIIKSIQVIPPKFYNKYSEISLGAIGNYYFSQDESYRDRVDTYEQAGDIAYGRYRVYNELKQKVNESNP